MAHKSTKAVICEVAVEIKIGLYPANKGCGAVLECTIQPYAHSLWFADAEGVALSVY